MLRGLLNSKDYRAQFSGHETFPLRQLWLRKAYDEVAPFKDGAPKAIFSDPDAIARFGVGKNMVSAIRHWAIACDVIREIDDGYEVGDVGRYLFSRRGADPYLEYPASIWLLHWHLAGEGRRSTTWYWLFNHVPGPVFERDDVVRGLKGYCEDRKRGRSSAATLVRDVDVCLRSYAPKVAAGSVEDFVEPILGELGLLAHTRGSEYSFRIGAKPTLPDGVVLFALTRYWTTYASASNALSLDTLAFEPGAIGPVFKLDVESLAERLADIAARSGGAYAWSETAGLKQVIRRRVSINPFDFLDLAYQARA
jgi:hypothetical protein